MVNVSVVITTYGRYNYIGEAIESVLKQTLKPREIVVVADDPDKVPFKDRVYVVDRGRDRRYGPAILKGVDATTSDAIALLEDDDKFHPDKLKVVARILERYPEVTAVHNHRMHIDVSGKPIDDNDPRVRHFVKGQPGFALLLNKRNVWIWFRRYPFIDNNVSSMVVRRGVFERHRPIIRNIELSMDSALFILSVNDGHYLHIPMKLTAYRIGSGETNMDVWGDPTKVRLRLCTMIRHAHDYYILHNYVRDSTLKKLHGSSTMISYWLFRSFIDCGVEIPLTPMDMLRNSLNRLRRANDLPSFINAIQGMLFTLLGLSGWDKKWLADFYLRAKYGVDLASLIQSK